MSETTALIWKEWRETRLFLAIAWGLFIGLPIIGTIENGAGRGRQFEPLTIPWVMGGGLILAVVVGVAGTCRDLKPRLEEFWLSRPIGSVRLFVIKYLVGLSVLMLACDVPILLQWHFERASDELSVEVMWINTQVILIFSVAFASGCIFRRPSNAAAVSIAMMLLIYFAPLIVPPLHRFGMGSIVDETWKTLSNRDAFGHWPLIDFLATALILILSSLAIGVVSVSGQLHVESSRPLLYGGFTAAFVLLLLSVSWQVGTNLTILDQQSLPSDEYAGKLTLNGSLGTIITRVHDMQQGFEVSHGFIRDMRIENEKLVIGSRRTMTRFEEFSTDQRVVDQTDASIGFELESTESEPTDFSLIVQHFDNHGRSSTALASLPLPGGKNIYYGWLHQSASRLFVIGTNIVAVDVSNPRQSKIISTVENALYRTNAFQSAESFSMPLPNLEGCSPQDRFDCAVRTLAWQGVDAFSGDCWCHWERNESRLSILKRTGLTADRADYQLKAEFRPSFLQSMFSSSWWRPVQIEDGLLYTVGGQGLVETLDVTSGHKPKVVAHFASPALAFLTPLSDGRSVAGGSTIYLLAAPKR